LQLLFETIEVMTDMKTSIYGLALAALLAIAPAYRGHAEEATTPPAAAAPPQAETRTPPPVSVARPSIVPKATAQPPAGDDAAASEATPERRWRSAHHRVPGYASFLQPFPIYLPQLHRNRIVWRRLSLFSF
jgi:hypothetical protein